MAVNAHSACLHQRGAICACWAQFALEPICFNSEIPISFFFKTAVAKPWARPFKEGPGQGDSEKENERKNWDREVVKSFFLTTRVVFSHDPIPTLSPWVWPGLVLSAQTSVFSRFAEFTSLSWVWPDRLWKQNHGQVGILPLRASVNESQIEQTGLAKLKKAVTAWFFIYICMLRCIAYLRANIQYVLLVSVYFHIFVRLSPSIYPSIHLSIQLSTHLAIYQSVNLSIYPFIQVFIYPSSH